MFLKKIQESNITLSTCVRSLVFQCSCNIHNIRKTFLTFENLKKHEMHFSINTLPNVTMLQNIFIILQHKTSHHICQQKNMLSWGFNLRVRIVCSGFPLAMLLPLWDLLGKFVSKPAFVSRSLWNLRIIKHAYVASVIALKEKPHFFMIKICIWITLTLYQ